MSEFTKEQREGLVKAFKAAKEILWDGHGSDALLRQYICHALDDVWAMGQINAEARKTARALVMSRIAPSYAAGGFFVRVGRIPAAFTSGQVQAERQKFLDELIEEFSA